MRPINTGLLRTITISTIILGCTGVIFLSGALVQFITVSQINQIFGLKRMNTQIDKLAGHVIICGFGRIGREVAKDLTAGDTRFVVVERDEARVEQARALGYLCLQADATDEARLEAAGVMRAHTLATVLPTDAVNVFITLSARSLNPALEIIARGDAPSSERKLAAGGGEQGGAADAYRGGADRRDDPVPGDGAVHPRVGGDGGFREDAAGAWAEHGCGDGGAGQRGGGAEHCGGGGGGGWRLLRGAAQPARWRGADPA